MKKANVGKIITKESIDKKLGFDFTTYDDGTTSDTESYLHYGDPFDILMDEELEFVIGYFVDRDKPITKESIDKKLGFDFTTYTSGIRTDTECDIEYENPFKILTDEEGEFILEYYREQKRNKNSNADTVITKESIDKKLGFDFTTYDDGISIDIESDIPHENPFEILTEEERRFIINYGIELMRKKKEAEKNKK